MSSSFRTIIMPSSSSSSSSSFWSSPTAIVGAVGVSILYTYSCTLSSSSTSSSSSTHWDTTMGSSVIYITTSLIENLLVPIYTLLVVVYLILRFLDDLRLKQVKQKIEAAKRQAEKRREAEAAKAVVGGQPTEGDDDQDKKPIDLTGDFKLMENHNFESFLAAQGVPWALRRAANGARPTHKITHHTTQLITIQICGIIESSTTYEIGGLPVEGEVRGRRFSDQVEYMTKSQSIYDQEIQQQQEKQNGNSTSSGTNNDSSDDDDPVVGIQTTKCALDDGYTVRVQRRLVVTDGDNNQGGQIIMTSTVTFDDPSRQSENVTSRQIFDKVL